MSPVTENTGKIIFLHVNDNTGKQPYEQNSYKIFCDPIINSTSKTIPERDIPAPKPCYSLDMF